MRFLFRLILYILLFMLGFRLIRALMRPRSSEPRSPEGAEPSRSRREQKIEDANFTEIKD